MTCEQSGHLTIKPSGTRLALALGAAAIGFLAGRLLVPADRRQSDQGGARSPGLSPHRGETDEITAAVSQLAAQPTGGGKAAGYGAELDDRSETR